MDTERKRANNVTGFGVTYTWVRILTLSLISFTGLYHFLNFMESQCSHLEKWAPKK